MRKNTSFLNLQFEKTMSDMKLAASGLFTTFECAGAKFDNPRDYADFVGFKLTVVQFCMKAKRSELEKILKSELEKLCPTCKKAADFDNIFCNTDFRRLVFCEYVRRTLS